MKINTLEIARTIMPKRDGLETRNNTFKTFCKFPLATARLYRVALIFYIIKMFNL